MTEKILAIIVLYNTKLSNSVTFLTLKEAIKTFKVNIAFFIYDNSSISQGIDSSFDTFSIYYIHDPLNSGLSVAYNKGANYARTHNIDWILLLDQDTHFSKNFFNENIKAIRENQNINLFVPILKLSNGNIFSPCRYRHKRGYKLKNVCEGKYSLNRTFPVNSGMFLKTDAFFEVGGYNEKIKIDFCDFQFLEKFRNFYQDYYIINSIGFQDFSNNVESIEKQKIRFLIFLNDALNCSKNGIRDRFWFLYVVTRHAFGLSLKLRSFNFIKLFLLKYLFRTY